MEFFDDPKRLAKHAGTKLLDISLNEVELELVQSINPDQVAIEGLNTYLLPATNSLDTSTPTHSEQ